MPTKAKRTVRVVLEGTNASFATDNRSWLDELKCDCHVDGRYVTLTLPPTKLGRVTKAAKAGQLLGLASAILPSDRGNQTPKVIRGEASLARRERERLTPGLSVSLSATPSELQRLRGRRSV